MKTLYDYIRGYPSVPVLQIAAFRHAGNYYQLAKEESHDSFYFMKGQEVIYVKRYPEDKFPHLAIAHINNRRDESIIEEIKQCLSYKAFVKFIKEQTGEIFSIK